MSLWNILIQKEVAKSVNIDDLIKEFSESPQNIMLNQDTTLLKYISYLFYKIITPK